MDVDGDKTFWGQDFGIDTEEGIRELLCEDKTLDLGGRGGGVTATRAHAKAIIEDLDMHGLNARHLMLKYKQTWNRNQPGPPTCRSDLRCP